MNPFPETQSFVLRSMAEKKFFTPEEANSLVPRLLEIVPAMQQIHARMSREFPDVRQAWKKARENGGSLQGSDYLACVLRFNRYKHELERMGAVLKGVENGLVDFPSLRDGREVYLCWKHPETEIRYWHDLDTGFSGRRPI